MVASMNLNGIVRQLAAHCVLVGRKGNTVQLYLDADGEHYRTTMMEDKLTQALSTYYGEPVRLEFTASNGEALNTPARQQKAAADDRLQNARASIENDPNVRAMRDIFGATVQPDSIRPTEN